MSSKEQDLFSWLPPELINMVVDNLAFDDGLRLSHCNRRLYKIIGQHNKYWQRHLDEEANLSLK